jgi:lipopolysaccharide biosynthesis glycosyltransferase
MIKVFVGFDQREAVAYHTFCQSVIDNASRPVSFIPLSLSLLSSYDEVHRDGSNTFIYTRFLTPFLCDFEGWAIFADGDMICRKDICYLLSHKDDTKAVSVVMHEYKTKRPVKYMGNKNEDYPRKNWSSVILWNCSHPKNRCLTPEFVKASSGAFLHRFSWLDDSEIGELPREWNWLTTEYEDNEQASLLHYTLGTPCFSDFKNSEMAECWHEYNQRSQEGFGK